MPTAWSKSGWKWLKSTPGEPSSGTREALFSLRQPMRTSSPRSRTKNPLTTVQDDGILAWKNDSEATTRDEIQSKSWLAQQENLWGDRRWNEMEKWRGGMVAMRMVSGEGKREGEGEEWGREQAEPESDRRTECSRGARTWLREFRGAVW